MRWYRRVERKLLETSMYNAYVLEGHIVEHNPPGKTKRDYLSFKLDLAHELIGDFHHERRRLPGRPRSAATASLQRLDGKNHWPVKGEGRDHVCAVCNKHHRDYNEQHPGTHYSENPHKRRKASMKCEKCEVYLCCNPQAGCFKEYHTLVNY